MKINENSFELEKNEDEIFNEWIMIYENRLDSLKSIDNYYL